AARLLPHAPHTLLAPSPRTALDELRAAGFSYGAIDRFFAPFFGGIFLRRDLGTSASLLRYYFRMLMDGAIAVPRRGIGEVTRQLARGLDVSSGVRVERLDAREDGVTVRTSLGDVHADAVIVATDPPELARLAGVRTTLGSVGSTYLHLAADVPLDPQPRLLLNAGQGVINNALWSSNTNPDVAPPGKHLLTVTVLDRVDQPEESLDHAVRAVLSRWYGAEEVAKLRLLAVDRVPHAQFAQPPGFERRLAGHATALPNVLIASELTSASSIQGAMESGEKAAAILLGDVVSMSRPRGA
ncbi:FAD-dependent oxidoreductase, partial [Deinococcus pimensis]|uniref:FAD-dependent oxidoreductase n=1 Tax=Deinococcus pimensis TaxID=309888 RepID=UPI00048286F8